MAPERNPAAMSPPTTPKRRSTPYSTQSPKKKDPSLFIPTAQSSQLRYSPKKPSSPPQKPPPSALRKLPEFDAPHSQHVVSKVAMHNLRTGLDESESADTVAEPRRHQPCTTNPAKSAECWAFSRAAFQAYLDDAKSGWVRDVMYQGIVGDIEVYLQLQPDDSPFYVNASRVVIISSEGVLSANQFVPSEQRAKNESFIATPSLWAYELAQTVGQEPFFLFFRHGAYLEYVKYYGQCRIRDLGWHLSKEQWDTLGRTEQNVVAALLHKLRDRSEMSGDIISPFDLAPREPWVHARVYAIERGPLVAAFFEHVRNSACVAAVPPKEFIKEAKGPRRHIHLPSPGEMKMD